MNNKRKRSKKIFIIVGILLLVLILVVAFVVHRMIKKSESGFGGFSISAGSAMQPDLSSVLKSLEDISNQITSMEINQTLLNLTGLKDDVDSVINNQSQIGRLCTDLESMKDSPSLKTKQGVITTEDLNKLNEQLDTDFNKALDAKKSRDLAGFKTCISNILELQTSILNDLQELSDLAGH